VTEETAFVKRFLPEIALLAWCVLCLTAVPNQASAYIDPSTTTFIIQAAAGVVVAIAAGVSIYWRKARKKISKAVGKETVTRDESDDLEDL
jgi:hypothetical protein